MRIKCIASASEIVDSRGEMLEYDSPCSLWDPSFDSPRLLSGTEVATSLTVPSPKSWCTARCSAVAHACRSLKAAGCSSAATAIAQSTCGPDRAFEVLPSVNTQRSSDSKTACERHRQEAEGGDRQIDACRRQRQAARGEGRGDWLPGS